MTAPQRDAGLPRGPCVPVSVHRLRYAWLAAIGLLLLVVTALWSLGDQPYAAERRAFDLVNGLPEALAYLLIPVMQAGSLAAVFAAGILALIARRPRLAGLVVMAGGSAWVLAKLVKRVVERGRPDEYLTDVVIRGAVQMGQGFPSGHAAVIAAMATVATPYLSRPGRLVVWTVVGLVALARVYTGAHLPLDVVAGVMVGWGFGCVVNLTLGTPAFACCPRSRLDCTVLE
ncbi:MAG TPA: phosphatase PAP2 family protein [Thermoleophilia bacterium]|nr:phosphatase PAP2 family protein [Thermoleophilia bacterium]